MQKFDTIVIGGGAAGLMAAGKSAELGNKVLLLEKMSYTGRKLGITGKGRCNITNTATLEDFISKVEPDGKFLQTAFSEFFSTELISFFNRIGVDTVIERGKRVFPKNGSAVELAKSLKKWCVKNNVQIKNNFKVEELIVQKNSVVGVKGFVFNKEKNVPLSYYSDKIIIATGGKSYPATGSTGDGYKLAESVGHKISSTFPALVPLETHEDIAKNLNGLDLRNVRATIIVDGNKIAEDFGEMSFTGFGITGPIILGLSRKVVFALQQNKKVFISINLKPALSDIKLDNRLIREFDKQRLNNFRTVLNKLLPKKLIPVCINETRISNKMAYKISPEERTILRNWLKDFNFQITGHRPYSEAIITAGGIDINEINPETMQSKLVKGLYFAGEVLNLDAPTGGYNLQIAFSTGWIAGNKL